MLHLLLFLRIRRCMVFMSAILILASAPLASAGLITETLQNATFYDGGVASGSFVFDTVSSTVTSWSISVSGGNIGTFPPITYSPINSTSFVGTGDLGLPRTAFDFTIAGNRAVRILVENSLPPGGGTHPFHIWPDREIGHRAGFECFSCAPFRNFSGGSLTLVSNADTNMALGKPVTLIGTFGSDPPLPPTLTDGMFRPKNTFWQDGTVWWDGTAFPDNRIEIDLGGLFTVHGLIIQADDNDAYFLDYKDANGTWQRAWDVPNYDFEPFGMQTRPNPSDDTELYLLPAPITASELRFYGDPINSDRLFSVSEVQAFGVRATIVPEPGTWILMLSGVAAGTLLRLRWRRKP